MALFSLGRGKSVQAGVTICCLVAFVLFGYDQGVFGGILQNENWQNQFDHPNDTKTGIIVSCYNLGCLAGCVINFFLGDKLGRRRTIWLAMGLVLVGAILQTTAYNVPHLIIGRVVTGFGTGIKTSTVPMYQSELCEAESRGRLVSSEVLFVGVGITIAYWFDFGMSYVGGAIAWRLPIAFQIVFAVGVIILVFALPESPRWLLIKGREQEAIDVMYQVHDKDPSDPYIISESASIQHAIELERAANKNESFLSIFRKDSIRTRYRILLKDGNHSIQFNNVGLPARTAQILGGCINMMFMFGSILPSFALDRMGRRKTMLWGCSGLSICMLMVAALLSRVGYPNGHACASAAVAFFFLYMLIFGMSVNCVPWVYVPEILPLEARTRGTAIGISSNWLWNFTVVMITPVIINRLQWKAYLIFMVTNLLFVPAFYFFYPETSNFKLEDIDMIFSQGGNPVSVARQMMKSGQVGTKINGRETSAGTEKGHSVMVESA
ncbi:hypothetical protein BFJ69_g16081 [Fusarium oxysporum]|uniref:Major facilitator superfamily (MFS) profile domain-containing protein n=1 Tax=Fusarium oxysporum TaxID=5507 RepID=A0A420MC97_FUSOX|nr:hypothetical protein BFJ69_g16081 [Fusarium oxysporum]